MTAPVVIMESGKDEVSIEALSLLHSRIKTQSKHMAALALFLKPFEDAVSSAESALNAAKKIIGLTTEMTVLNELQSKFNKMQAQLIAEADKEGLWVADDFSTYKSKNPVHMLRFEDFAILRTQTITKTIDVEKLLKDHKELTKFATMTLKMAQDKLTGEQVANYYGPSKVDYGYKIYDKEEEEAKANAVGKRDF